MLSMNVVSANAARPSGPGSAIDAACGSKLWRAVAALPPVGSRRETVAASIEMPSSLCRGFRAVVSSSDASPRATVTMRGQSADDGRFAAFIEIPKGSRNKYEYDHEL